VDVAVAADVGVGVAGGESKVLSSASVVAVAVGGDSSVAISSGVGVTVAVGPGVGVSDGMAVGVGVLKRAISKVGVTVGVTKAALMLFELQAKTAPARSNIARPSNFVGDILSLAGFIVPVL
jgi:hypothetical protein